MKFFKKLPFVIVFAFLILVSFNRYSQAQSNENKLDELNKQIQEYSEKIKSLQGEATTLSNQIAQFDAQIGLTQARINQTEEQIRLLGGRIDQLEVSLDSLNEAFNSRITEIYKMSRLDTAPMLVLSSDSMNQAVSTYHYLQKIQEADKALLSRLTSAKDTYSSQKDELEGLQEVLNTQKAELDIQKRGKANLLAVTKNDEARYQQLLEQARAEYEAIQAIIAGSGDEEEAGRVNVGDRIATVIQGASCNSSGAHLHFIVSQGGNSLNPFSYLKPGMEHENCSGSSCGSSDGDPFNPSGSWDWPMNGPVKYTQGYGRTWAVNNSWVGRIYNFHNGIDINNAGSPAVKAVQPGTLYRGSFSGYQGCRLRYVRVDHDDSDINTYYLHINY